MSRVLVVDDERNIRELVHILLEKRGFEVDEAVGGREALAAIEQKMPDIAIIDLMMPGMDGYELCSAIREYYGEFPILMLTAKSDIRDKVKGFETGADDYLTKPFEGEELVLRVKALLKRSHPDEDDMLYIGNIMIDKGSRQIEYKDEQYDIPLKEFELLLKLAASAGKTLSRNKLIEDIWGWDFEGNERTLDVHIGRIRDRFPPSDAGFTISTQRGFGYRLDITAGTK